MFDHCVSGRMCFGVCAEVGVSVACSKHLDKFFLWLNINSNKAGGGSLALHTGEKGGHMWHGSVMRIRLLGEVRGA